jgi:hypothetical protein
MQTSRKNRWERVPRQGFLLLGFAAVVVAVLTIWRISGTQAEITGTISQTEPPVRPDGTAAHPYSDASQCPTHTDLVFWPSGRLVPSFPASISVCFVGNESFENGGSDRVEVRER